LYSSYLSVLKGDAGKSETLKIMTFPGASSHKYLTYFGLLIAFEETSTVVKLYKFYLKINISYKYYNISGTHLNRYIPDIKLYIHIFTVLKII